jgi:hypothetical protein
MPSSTPSLCSTSPLICLVSLEARYDGPIPAAERRALAFGSALEADIAETSAEIAFFRAMIERTRRAGKAWLHRGNREMAAHARFDLRLYLSAWRSRRSRLAKLLHHVRVRGTPVGDATRQTLAVIATQIIAPLVEGAEEDCP